jgi:glyoxylase-like metal-dependent hydrolase (beta-lactamase superfamily II)
MKGIMTRTAAGPVTIHTYTAPETGWMVNSHLIELPHEIILFDTQLTPQYAGEVLAAAASVGKEITRVYLSHAHPDHFVGASLIEAPTYALPSVKSLIDGSGDLRIERGYKCTPGHEDAGSVKARPVDHEVVAGEEVIDGIRFAFHEVADAETTDQLAIGLPDVGVLMAQDVLYNQVHLFIGEHAFADWEAALDALEQLPYDVLLPGHGLPGDRGLYDIAREYLAVAGAALAAATGPEDLNRRLEAAFPQYGGTAMQGLQNFYLFPANR